MTERTAVILMASALVVCRAFVFIWWEQSHFDADQAVVGLMAKHLIELRAFPLFFYGQQYLLGVESWIVAPFFLLGGVSVAMLKLPLVVLNLAVVALLILGLERYVGIRPWLAGLASLPVILPSPGAASRLVQANGCNIEPFLYVLLIWYLRARPLWLGIVVGIGLMNREFTVYGVTALMAVELCEGRLWSRDRWRSLGLAAIVALGVWQAVQAAIPFASPRGPGTSYAVAGVPTHAAEVSQRVCWSPDAPERLAALVTFQLPELLGAQRQPVQRVGIMGDSYQGIDGLWPVLVAVLVLAAGRTAWLLGAGTAAVSATPLAFGAYLALVGGQSALVYGMTCGQRSHLTMRYMLLALLVPVGIGACYLVVERSRRLVTAFVSVMSVWAVVSAAAHLALLVEYVGDPPPAEYRLLANYLERQQVRYGRAAYWDAYVVTFLSDERVRLGSADLVRVEEYVTRFERHRGTAVNISSSRCEGPRVARWWVCAARTP